MQEILRALCDSTRRASLAIVWDGGEHCFCELMERLEASQSWHVDETYIRVGGKWRYLWRAVDQHGQLVDFRLTARRDLKAARAFLKQACEYAPAVSTALDHH